MSAKGQQQGKHMPGFCDGELSDGLGSQTKMGEIANQAGANCRV